MKSVLIESKPALDKFCTILRNEPVLAVDTEFFRETSYYPELGLVQIASPEHIVCIDPLAFDAKEALASILLDPAITKVFHACIQDMEVLYLYLGQLPCPAEDTQIAAALLGEKDQAGYANLVLDQLGVILEKSQTRTNWLRRPLSEKQLDYAADDVRYLLPLHKKLVQELNNKGRYRWLQDECDNLCKTSSRFLPDIENCWKRVKGTSKLDSSKLAIIDSIAQWREKTAMQKNITRRKVIPDDLIVEIANQQPPDHQTLGAIGRLSSLFKTSELTSLFEAITNGCNKPQSEWPTHTRIKLNSSEKNYLKAILELIRNKANELGIAPSVLCSRKDAERLVSGERNLSVLDNWRLDVVGNGLLSVVND